MYATHTRNTAHRGSRPRTDRRRASSPAIVSRDRIGLLLIAAWLIFLAGVQIGLHHGASLYGCR
jgi:hypothetical protein